MHSSYLCSLPLPQGTLGAAIDICKNHLSRRIFRITRWMYVCWIFERLLASVYALFSLCAGLVNDE